MQLPWHLLQLASVVMAICVVGNWAKIVNTKNGKVEGNTLTLHDGTTVNSWYGIPFAKPPVGNLRFEPPQPPGSWSSVFNAKRLPNSCIQIRYPFPSYALPTNISEDCLYLNVFAPQVLSNAPLAVMVWIHGGGYQNGANVLYIGHFLAAKDVIVVIPNYRLGIFGFLATPDGTVSGNMGLKDQRMALLWVRDNIANFGGDPSRVTIFGESAGATSVSLHMLSPRAKGLFHRAIADSGTEISSFALNLPSKHPKRYVYQTAQLLNCKKSTDKATVTCLKTKTPQELLNPRGSAPCPSTSCFLYLPIVDGPGGYLPKTPAELQYELLPSDTVPFIGGIMRDDGSFFTTYYYPDLFYGGINKTTFEQRLRQLVNIFGYGPGSDQLERVFQAIRWNYVSWSQLNDAEANREALVRFFTDFSFGDVWNRQLKIKSSKNSNVYGFVFAFLSPNASSAAISYPPWKGISHTYELPYVFGFPKLINNPEVRTDASMFVDVVGWTARDVTFSNYVIKLWTNFAKYGNPTPTPINGPFSNTALTWPKFSVNNEKKVLYLDANARAVADYNLKNYAFIDNFLPFLNSTMSPPKSTCPPGKTRVGKTKTWNY